MRTKIIQTSLLVVGLMSFSLADCQAITITNETGRPIRVDRGQWLSYDPNVSYSSVEIVTSGLGVERISADESVQNNSALDIAHVLQTPSWKRPFGVDLGLMITMPGPNGPQQDHANCSFGHDNTQKTDPQDLNKKVLHIHLETGDLKCRVEDQ
jgi:hypothetical protein